MMQNSLLIKLLCILSSILAYLLALLYRKLVLKQLCEESRAFVMSQRALLPPTGWWATCTARHRPTG